MNPLLKRLAWLRRRLYLWTGARGVWAVLALLLGTGVLAGLLDWVFVLPALIRAFALAAIIAGAGFLAFRLLLQPFLAPKDDLSLALQVESAYPQLNDVLGSTVQFLGQAPDTPNAGSAQMRQQAVEQALKQTEGCDFGSILDRRGALLAGLAFLLAAAAAAFLFFKFPLYSTIAAERLADPFGNHTWTRVELNAPNRVAVKKPYEFQARLTGVIPKNALVQIEGFSELQKADVLGSAEDPFVWVKIPLTKEVGTFRFRILAGDGSYPTVPGSWHQVDVLDPPGLTQLLATLKFPSYTGEPPFTKTSTRGLVHLSHEHFVAGSVVRLQGATDRPVAEAWLEVRPHQGVPARDKKTEDKREPWEKEKFRELGAAVSGLLGAPSGLEGLPLAAAGQGPSARFVPEKARYPLRFLDDKRQRFEVDFEAWAPGKYALYLEDDDRLAQELEGNLGLKVDEIPEVALGLAGFAPGLFLPKKDDLGAEIKLGARKGEEKKTSYLEVVPDALLRLNLTAREKEYHLRSLFLEMVAVEKEKPVGTPIAVLVGDLEVLGRTASGLLAGAPAATPGTDADTGIHFQALFDLPTELSLAHRFKVGEKVFLRACAQDVCDVFLDREPGRSDPIRLQILSKEALFKAEDEILPFARGKINKAREDLEKAMGLIKEIKGDKKADPKFDPRLINAETLHGEIKEALEDLLEGVKERVAVRDINKLTSRKAGDVLKRLKGDLEKLIEGELRDLKDATEKVKKAEEKKEEAASLDKVGGLQGKTGEALKKMADLLEPFQTLHTIRAKAEEILVEQTDLRNATEKLQEDRELLGGILEPERTAKEKDLRDELVRKGDSQTNLGTKMEELLKLIRDEEKRRAAEGDGATAGRLKKAHDIGAGGKVPERMRAVGGELRQEKPKLHKSIQDQDNIKITLRGLIKALDERKSTEDMDRLAKVREKTEKNLKEIEGIRKELEDIRDRRAKARAMKDEKERDAEMVKIRKDEVILKTKLEDLAREIARLEEPKAAAALKDAAKEIGKDEDKEGKKGGGIDEAIEKVDAAGKELEKTRAELDREQLAQIADLIQGLKDREDELIARGEELHKKVQEKHIWSDGLRDTLDKSAAVQKGLAEEVKGLKEKLKDAIVFADIMEKAGRSMGRAADEMGSRHKMSGGRVKDAMLKEELADEDRRQAETKRHQVMASQRLGRLLDAVKDAKPVAKKGPPKKDPEKKGKDDKGAKADDPGLDGGGGGGGPGDSIPPVAQLKVLKTEQVEIRERTKEFNARFPDRKDLAPEVRRDLEELQEDQIRIHQLFERMTVPADKKGGRS